MPVHLKIHQVGTKTTRKLRTSFLLCSAKLDKRMQVSQVEYTTRRHLTLHAANNHEIRTVWELKAGLGLGLGLGLWEPQRSRNSGSSGRNRASSSIASISIGAAPSHDYRLDSIGCSRNRRIFPDARARKLIIA